MKVTKTQLKEIIKEELTKVLSEADDYGENFPFANKRTALALGQQTAVGKIPRGSVVIPSSDPYGIAYTFEIQVYGQPEDAEGEISLWDLSPLLLDELADREDLILAAHRHRFSREEFRDFLPEFWYDSAIEQHNNGYMVSALPDWVYKEVGAPPLNFDDEYLVTQIPGDQ